jgi:hypothetical protein
MRQSQSGNVLIFILISIFLLGGLTVLLSRTGSQSEDTGNTEQAMIAATEILRQTSNFKNTVQMMMGRGCSESTFSFETPDLPRYANTDAPADKSCHLFEPQGGGLNYKFVPNSYINSDYSSAPYYGYWVFLGRICIDNIGPTGGNNCKTSVQNPNELFVVLGFVREDICLALNRLLGHPWSTIPAEPNTPWPPAYADGLYSTAYKYQPTPYTGMTALLSGKEAACFETTTVPGTYHFYQVLIPR